MRRWLWMACAGTALLWSSPAAAQFFSPGPLARAHASLEGLETCAKCHEEKKGLAARLCLDCHTELQSRVAKGLGFHGRLPAAKKQECQGCHPDHRGLDFVIVDWEGGRNAFDHQKTGWPLKGAHGKVHCDGCHQRPLIADAAIRRMLEREPRRTTFLGAPARCDGCHFDEHRGQLARECQRCHNETAWKPVPAFNHQTTDYPLRGKHREVACAKCHPTATDDDFAAGALPRPRSAAFMQMKPIEHDTCESCHNDPHKGSLGPNCAGCHSEAGWKIINASKGQDTTFHDNTKFPLRGAHIAVGCKSCHGPFPGQPARFKGLASGACSDCHEDAHLGQLRAKPPARVAACDGCHTVNAFLPARYEAEQHQGTRFQLDGAHAAVACRGCHPIDAGLEAHIPVAVRLRLKARRRPELFSFAVMHPQKAPQACNGCHEDVHRGQFTADDPSSRAPGTTETKTGVTAGGKSGARSGDRSGEAGRKPENRSGALDNCIQCHKTTSFADLTFDHNKDSKYPLTGRHAEAPCAGCHRPTRVGAGRPFVRYKPLDVACARCHTDYHQGQFLASVDITRDSDDRVPAPAHGCDFCHTTTRFKDSLFDHGDPRFSQYPLEGKHAQVACGRCHPTIRLGVDVLGADVVTVRYRPLPRACEDCHTDFHHGEFRGFEP